MRIGVNTRILLEGRLEGIGLFTHEVLKRLVEMRPDDDFVFFFDREPSDVFIYSERVKPVVVRPQARHPILWYLWFERSLPRAMKRENIDCFFSPDGYGSLRSRLPSAVVIHDLAFNHYPEHIPYLVGKYYRHYTPKYVSSSDELITVSEFSKRDIVATYGCSPDKITVVGNGSDAAIKPIGSVDAAVIRQEYTGGDPYFLYVGSIHPRKNVGGLLKSFEIYKQRNPGSMKLLLAGRWAWKTAPERAILKRMSSKEDVILTGHLERTDVGRVIAASEALIYPSFFEGFGIPALEAMCAEVPVITSADSSMAEVCGPAAVYIDPADPGSIAEAMDKIHSDQVLATDLISKGRSQRELFSWEKTAAKVNSVLDRIKKGKPQ